MARKDRANRFACQNGYKETVCEVTSQGQNWICGPSSLGYSQSIEIAPLSGIPTAICTYSCCSQQAAGKTRHGRVKTSAHGREKRIIVT